MTGSSEPPKLRATAPPSDVSASLRRVARNVSLRVEGLVPPKKDGANSMWRSATALPLIKELRTQAVAAMAGDPPLDEPVRLTLRVFLPRQADPSALWARRVYGDLDNFITGVCDALQMADARAFDADDWLHVPADTNPSRTIAFTDDSWVHAIHAEVVDADDSRPAYDVEIRPLR